LVIRWRFVSSSPLITFRCNTCSQIQPCVKNLIIRDFTPYFATTISWLSHSFWFWRSPASWECAVDICAHVINTRTSCFHYTDFYLICKVYREWGGSYFNYTISSIKPLCNEHLQGFEPTAACNYAFNKLGLACLCTDGQTASCSMGDVLQMFRNLIIHLISYQCYTLRNLVPLTNAFHTLFILFKIRPTEKKPVHFFLFEESRSIFYHLWMFTVNCLRRSAIEALISISVSKNKVLICLLWWNLSHFFCN
jgi:hypothetical protein